jgi:glycosyltransferase involved in cell wall biosynthesis
MRPYFSIIIPLYKTENFLEECILSVKNQSFENFECIVVNDGSPGVELTELTLDLKNNIDLSNLKKVKQAETIFKYIVKDDRRFKYFEKINEGLGPTKDFAINKTIGERLVILDSDDLLDSNYLQESYNKITEFKQDTIFFGNVKLLTNNNLSNFKDSQKFVPNKNNLKSILVFPTWTVTPVCYFWQIDLIKKYKIKNHFINKGEDTCFVIDMILSYRKEYGIKNIHNNFIKIDNSYYIYRQFPNQMTRADGFEIELFKHTTLAVKSRLTILKNFGFIYYILGVLFIYRFTLYRKRLETKNKILNLTYNTTVKTLTLFSLLISGVKKL